jgi:hypothetical protein
MKHRINKDQIAIAGIVLTFVLIFCGVTLLKLLTTNSTAMLIGVGIVAALSRLIAVLVERRIAKWLATQPVTTRR